MDFLTLLGTTGAAIILFAFVMNQTHQWTDEYLIYDLFNFAGSGLLVWYAILLDSTPFLLLNSVWALVSLRDIIFDLNRNKQKHERSFFKKWMQ